MAKKNILKKLKEEEKKKKKNLIIDAAISLFAKNSPDEIHLKDIAGELGISAPTIYQYFESRDDLFVEIFNKEILNIVKYVEKKIEADNDETLEAITRHSVHYFIENEGGFQIITYFLVKNNIPSDILKRARNAISNFLTIIDEGFKNLGIEGDTLMLVHTLIGSVTGGILIYRNYPDYDKKDVDAIIYDLAILNARAFKKKSKNSVEGDSKKAAV
jgi:AcrR family transcriptional regulator